MLRSIISLVLVLPLAAQQPPPPSEGDLQGAAKFGVTTNLVVINVSVKDRDGKPVEGLKREDFSVFEDGKRQAISVFDWERLASQPLPPLAPAPPAQPPAEFPKEIRTAIAAPAGRRFQDRRLIVLYFDFSSMAPPEQVRAGDAAIRFLEEQMTSSDLVAVFAYSTELRLLQDFTDDRAALVRLIRATQSRDASELAESIGGSQDEAAGESDDSEFDLFNTDKKLSALEQTARELGRFPEKKALVYISSGVNGTGIENQSQLRSTVNAAVRANVAFYPIDTRGLVASAPAGDAGSSSRTGAGLFSGSAVAALQNRGLSRQDTLHMLAADTGGKALFDSNDLTLGIRQAQQGIGSYYILGYNTTNPNADGKFRQIRVEVSRLRGAVLEYRPGYYAPKLFQDFNPREKEQQLVEALLLNDPVTELPIAIEINYFRLAQDKYFVPVAVKIPGAGIALTQKGAVQETEFDFVGRVQNEAGRLITSVRDTIKVKLTQTAAGTLARRSLQYDAGFLLTPGNYVLKFLARENLEGKMGTFETRFSIPDLDAEKNAVRLSSVVLSGQREKLAAAVGAADGNIRRQQINPLVQQDVKLVPSVTRVFDSSQNLLVYLEAYAGGKQPSMFASLGLYRGKQRVWLSPPVLVRKPLPDRADAVAFQFQVPLNKLQSGQYLAQVSVIDQNGRKFAFSRAPLVVR